MKYIVIILGLILLSPIQLYSQELLPFIQNYNKQDYRGDNQVWDLTLGKDNALYFANNRFFLRYNGVKWDKYKLPNATIIRSVFADNDRIYCGSYNEFGFWEEENGIYNYISLSQKYLKDSFTTSEEVWKIFKWRTNIYFQTFNELYQFDGQSIKKFNTPFMISYSFTIDDKLYIATIKEGIYEMDEQGKFSYVDKWDQLKGNIIHGIEKINDIVYFFTKTNGVYYYDKTLLPWINDLNEELSKHLINTVTRDENNLYIGTVSNGLYIYNLKSKSYQNINRTNALQNNSVLSITKDLYGHLWLGLDNGISYVAVDSSIKLLTDVSGILGSVYDVVSFENSYFLGSNHGLFKFNNNTIELIENSQGQIWDLCIINDQLIIGHDKGTYSYKNGELNYETDINGGWKIQKSLFDNTYLQANYTGIAVFPDSDDFSVGKKLNINKGPIRDFIQSGPNEIIAAHYIEGLYKFKINQHYEVFDSINLTKKSKLNDFRVKIFSFNGENLYYINQNWYTYNKIQKKLDIHTFFNTNFKDITDIIPIDENRFGVLKHDKLYIISQQNDTFLWEPINRKYYDGRLINNETKIIVNNDKYIVNLDDGFMVFDSILDNNQIIPITIESIYGNSTTNDAIKIPYDSNLELNFVSDDITNTSEGIFYSLNDKPIIHLNDNKLMLHNLKEGNYTVKAYTFDNNNYKILTQYSFIVNKPWFKSWWMKIIYFMIIFLLLFIYYKWNQHVFREKIIRKEEELQHQKEMHKIELEAENKIKIEQYEKKLLENQVQLKANELAGKSLSLAKQTELIENIQEILKNEKSVAKVKNKISKAIKSNRLSKNEWKSFENNLLKSNEDFVGKLTIKYPALTPKDVKLCIYLKMNLTSKEIAPLMNISYRSVELHRYRLRKKLSMDQNDNLNTYLNNL